MKVSIPKEAMAGERRVAMVPDLVPKLAKAGLEVHVQAGAGVSAGFPDAAYAERGARIGESVLEEADIVLKIQPPSVDEVTRLRLGATHISLLYPDANKDALAALASKGATAFALERMPRISRAQPMDVLSAMSTVAGYKAVLMAADRLPKFFPLLMTAAGTVHPARVLIIGAGVAGLQAIGTAHRLGAVVEGYDTRPAVREQVESLGARFVDLGLEAKDAEAKTGYAKAQSEEFYQKQREALGKVVAAADVVITTALIPGVPAPRLITEDAVRAMRPGSVIVDLAAEAGGNCALTEPGREIVQHGVTIVGLLNVASQVPYHASEMYARATMNFLLYLYKDGALKIDPADDLTRGPLVLHQGVAPPALASRAS